MQRPVEVLAGADAGRLNGRERVERRARSDRNAGGAQRTREVEDILGEPALGHRPLLHQRYSAACSSARTSSSRLLALVWSMRPMSSWYLSNTPSVSLTVAGSSATTSSSASAP